MHTYKILADSSADVPNDLVKKYDLEFIPFYVNFDNGESYREGIEIKPREVYRRMTEEGDFPKTSTPTIDDYITAFEPHLKNGFDILCLCITSKFSGSFQSAVAARNTVLESFPHRKIEIIDTYQCCGAEGLLLLEAVKMREDGLSLEESAKKMLLLKKDACIYFTVDSLVHLQKGGRIGKVSAFAGTILNIKPIIMVFDGELLPGEKVRGTKRAIDELVRKTFSDIGDNAGEYRLCVVSAMRDEEALAIIDTLKAKYGEDVCPLIFPIGTTIGIHGGPTTLGICFIKKYTAV